MASLPSVNDAFGAPPPPPNSPMLSDQSDGFPQGMIHPAKRNPRSTLDYPDGVEAIGSIEITQDGIPFEALTIAREHGRDLSRDEMMQKWSEGHQFGGFDNPESATAWAKQYVDDGEPEGEVSAEVPMVDDVFGHAPSNFIKRADKALQDSTFRIFDAFGYGARQGFGREPIATPSTVLSPETEKFLKSVGAFNDYSKGQMNIVQGLFEGVFKGVAAGMALAWRSGAAVAGAPLGALGQTLEEAGLVRPGGGKRDLSSITQDPQLGQFVNPLTWIGIGPISPELSALRMQMRARSASNIGVDLSEARSTGVLAEGEAGFYGAKPVSPENAQARVQAASDAGLPTPIPEPAAPDVHVLARRIEPTAFEQFDALAAQKDAARERIRQIISDRENSPEAIAARAELDRLLGVRQQIERVDETIALDDETMTNPFLRPQPEEVPQPMLPTPPEGPVRELPVVDRTVFDEAALEAQHAEIVGELRKLPRGGRAEVDKLARLEAVERDLAGDITPERRRELSRRRDEILTDTTPEKLRAAAAPIERRRQLLAQREAVLGQLDELARGRERQRAEGAIRGTPVTPEALEAAPGIGVATRIEAAEQRLRAIIEAETPDLIEARAALRDAQLAQMDLIPQVSTAYRQAREMMPDPAPDVAKGVEKTSDGAAPPPGVTEQAGRLVDEAVPDARETVADAVSESAAVTPERVTQARQPGGTSPGIRPVQGTGPTKVRTLAEGVEARAIEERLTETFGELPEYEQVSMADQAARAQAFLDEDPAAAKAVAMGQKAAPRNVLPESIFVAVEKRAIAEGDVETLRQLATESKLTTAATTMGQRIRTLGERDKLSPVSAIQEVQDARRAAIEQRSATAVKDAVSEIKAEIRRTAPTRDAWAEFIQTIQCAD